MPDLMPYLIFALVVATLVVPVGWLIRRRIREACAERRFAEIPERFDGAFLSVQKDSPYVILSRSYYGSSLPVSLSTRIPGRLSGTRHGRWEVFFPDQPSAPADRERFQFSVPLLRGFFCDCHAEPTLARRLTNASAEDLAPLCEFVRRYKRRLDYLRIEGEDSACRLRSGMGHKQWHFLPVGELLALLPDWAAAVRCVENVCTRVERAAPQRAEGGYRDPVTRDEGLF